MQPSAAAGRPIPSKEVDAMRWQVLVVIVSIASTFAFLSVFWWALQRRRERESQLRYDLASRLLDADTPEERASGLLWLQQQEAGDQRRRRQGLALGGLVAVAAGLGALIAIGRISGGDAVVASWMSLLIGVAILLHVAVTRRLG
jgi:hypothetical protein